MNLTFAPKGRLEIEDARITFRNFSGKGDKYNREGDRNFALIIPDREMADALLEEGWNVKVKEFDDGEARITLGVKVKFNERGPQVYLINGSRRVALDEESVSTLDYIDIETIDMVIRPYDYEVQGKSGRAAYLEKIYVTQHNDRFADKYSDYEE